MTDDRPLSKADAALAESLGIVVAEAKQQFLTEARRDLELIKAEARVAIAEIRAVAAEVALARHDPEAAARLRTIAGGRQ